MVTGGPASGAAYSTEPGRLEILLLAMQGLGKPGVHQAKMIEWGLSDLWYPKRSPMPVGVVHPQSFRLNYAITEIGTKRASAFDKKGVARSELEKLTTPAPVNPTQFIPKDLIHEALLNPPISWYGNSTFPGTLEDQFVK